MKRICVTVLMVIFASSCGTSSTNQDAGDIQGQDVHDVTATDNAMPDSMTELYNDVHPVDVAPDLISDTGAGDITIDLVNDISTDIKIPAGCCLTEAECDGGSCVGAESHDFGLCFPALGASECWTDDDCGLNEKCHGAAYCPCGFDCDMGYMGHGVCAVEGQTCVTVPISEILETCDAANIFLFDGEKCVGTCPGCCNCGPWCDLTFATMDECETACGSVDTPTDQCINENDSALILADEDGIKSDATTCTMGCVSDQNPATCSAECTTDATGLSAGCATCYSNATVCMMNKCLSQCMTDPGSEGCIECQETEGCSPAFMTCKGVR